MPDVDPKIMVDLFYLYNVDDSYFEGDGENTKAETSRLRREWKADLKVLFEKAGRKVSEAEVRAWFDTPVGAAAVEADHQAMLEAQRAARR